MKVADIVSEKDSFDVIATSMDTPLRDAARVMADKRIGVLVCRDASGGVEGILSERDIVRAAAERPEDLPNLFVRDLATRNVVFCKFGDDVNSVAAQMKRHGFRHMPVCAGKMLGGVISITDIFRHYITHQPDQATALLKSYADPD
jgi:CBS domain-containing protein